MPTDSLFLASHAERLAGSARAKLACGAIHNSLRRRFNLPRGVSCTEALNTNEPYDVLILSWELPLGEGEAVLDWVQYQGIDDLAVVVLTARMDGDCLLQESLLPRVAWVQRPFRLVELLDAVKSTEPVPRRNLRPV